MTNELLDRIGNAVWDAFEQGATRSDVLSVVNSEFDNAERYEDEYGKAMQP